MWDWIGIFGRILGGFGISVSGRWGGGGLVDVIVTEF